MAGNRRGFIGIFSPQTEKLDTNSEEELELEKSEKSSKANGSVGDKNGAPKTESDWDDVFGEAPRQRSASGSIGAMLAGDPALSKAGSKSDHKDEAPLDRVEKATSDAPAPSNRKTDDKARDQKQGPDSVSAIDESTDPDAPCKNSPSKQKSDPSTDSTDHLPSATIMNDHPSAKSALSASDRLTINDAIQTLREKLSFARTNGNETPGTTMHLGTTGRDFVDKAMNAVQQNPDTLPRSFDDERFADDVELAKTLRLIGRDLDSLQNIVSDTEAKISTSTFLGALVVHGTGKIDSEAMSKDAYRRGGEGDAAKNDLNSMAMAGDTVGAT